MNKRVLSNFNLFLFAIIIAAIFVNCQDEQPEKKVAQLTTKNEKFLTETLTE